MGLFSKKPTEPVKKQEKPTEVAPPKINFEEKWKILQDGINRLIDFVGSKQKKPYNYAEHAVLYTTVYDICRQKSASAAGGPTEIMYNRYKDSLDKYLRDTVVPNLQQKHGEHLLLDSVTAWRNHLIICKWMQKVFEYLDRYYTKQLKRDSLNSIGIKCFQDSCYYIVRRDIATALLGKIAQDRDGDPVDRSVIKDGVKFIIEMGLGKLDDYETHFESPLQIESQDYYKRLAAKWLSQDSCPDYLNKAEEALNKEIQRCKLFFHAQTEPKVVTIVEDYLLRYNAEKVMEMNSGLSYMVVHYQIDEFSCMYRLFKRVQHLPPMVKALRDHIELEGTNLVNSYSSKETVDPIEYVNALLTLYRKYDDLITKHLEQEATFVAAFKEAFGRIVNKNIAAKEPTCELIASYFDYTLKNLETIAESELDDHFTRAVDVFTFLEDKDMFQEFYRRMLSKRLFASSKINLDAERTVIAKMKQRCGHGYTVKLEGMIKDNINSEDMTKQFDTWVMDKNIVLSCEFIPKVLTARFWPPFKVDKLTPPPEMAFCIQTFKDYYNVHNESKSLNWVYALGQCQVIGRFMGGSKDFRTSIHQACILVLFNDFGDESQNAATIVTKLGITMEDAKRHLLSLTHKTCPILIKTGYEFDCSAEDEFKVNQEFESKLKRLKLISANKVVVKEVKTDTPDAEPVAKLDPEVKEVEESTKHERKYAIEAAIVRIMKSRKTMDHQMLLVEVTKQLLPHFQPQVNDIKLRIDDLISREYLERDAQVSTSYNYLA